MRTLRFGNRGSPKGDLEAKSRFQKNSNIMELNSSNFPTKATA